MARLILWVGSGVGALWFGTVLMLELDRIFLWPNVGFAYYIFLPPLIVVTVAVARALASRVLLRPAWLGPSAVGIGMLLVALGAASALRSGSDWWTLRQWRSWDGMTHVWHEDYSERYRVAALETAHREAEFQARLDAWARAAGRPLPTPSIYLNSDPTLFTPNHPPDIVRWHVWRVRVVAHRAEDDVLVGVVTARWRSVPFPDWGHGGELTGRQRHQSVEVREVFQLSALGSEVPWHRVEASVRVDEPF